MATRIFEPKISATGGFLLPAGAGAGKRLKSDGSGNASWTGTQLIVEHSWSTVGEIKNETFGGIFVRVATGTEKKLIAIEYKIATGTSVKVKIEKNGAEISGFGTVTVEKTAAETNPADVTLADKDFINIVTTSATGTPTALSFTAFFEEILT